MKGKEKMKRTHARIVTECYLAIKKAEKDNNTDKLLNTMKRYGRKTLDDAMTMYNQEKAKEMGMTMDKFNKWLKEEA